MLEEKDNTFIFSVKAKEYEVFFANDGQVEVYETKNPEKTGFIFSNTKKFIIFINMLTDIMERVMEKGGEEKNECSEDN